MPLFEEPVNEEEEVPASGAKPRIQPEKYDSAIVDTTDTPTSALSQFIQGSSWTVDYYSQVLGEGDEPSTLDTAKSPTLQQYEKIHQMELKVTDPLNFTQTAQVNILEVRGSAIAYPFLVPNKGDMFIADVGDGRAGMFTITEVPVRQTIYRDTVYQIEYLLVRELKPANQVWFDDLEQKVTKKYYYSRESLNQAEGPFITEKAQERRHSYQEWRQTLINAYFNRFFSRQYGTLIVPDQLHATYDHFVAESMCEMIGSDEHNLRRSIRLYNVQALHEMMQPTIWDALLGRSDKLVSSIPRKANIISSTHFKGNVNAQSIFFTKITRVVHPYEVPIGVDASYGNHQETTTEGIDFEEGRPIRPLAGEYVPQAQRSTPWLDAPDLTGDPDPWQLLPDIHPIVHDTHYVFSQAFYEQDQSNQSKIETLVWQLIQGDALNLNVLDEILKQIMKWDSLEQFYYFPVMIALMKSAGRNE